jgi:hypothetical protein
MGMAMHRCTAAAWPLTGQIVAPTPGLAPGLQWFTDALHMPFDLMRSQYAEAVHAGLLANSMLASRDFEHTVDALEHVALGPLARSV